MSHLRPEDIVAFHKKSSCKKGRHRYGESQRIGGGIVRQVCLVCGAVTIDLTGAADPAHAAWPWVGAPTSAVGGTDR